MEHVIRTNADSLPLAVDQMLSRAIAYHQAGQFSDAECLYLAILQIQPNHSDANHNLGVLAAQVKKPAVALPLFKAAYEMCPEHERYCLSYAGALLVTGKAEEALSIIRSALQRGLDTPAIRVMWQEADAAAARLSLARKTLPERERNQLIVLFNAGHFAELESRALVLTDSLPDSGFVWMALGAALQAQGKDALPAKQKAASLLPGDAEAHYNLGNTLKDLGRLDEAVMSYRRVLELKPDYAAAHNNLGLSLQDLGQLDGAAASYRRALEIQPDLAEAHSNLLFCLTHNPAVDREALFFEHCRFGEYYENFFHAESPQHISTRNSERILRIGFVSADLRAHAVVDLLDAVLAHLSNSPQLTLHAYSNYLIEDAVTRRLRGYFTQWKVVAGMSDAEMDAQIRRDRIDILIDLSGHSGKNRLPVFAGRPAPVQASWIGYPGTTGLRSMDYYLADHCYLPEENFSSQFVEKIVYLPAVAAFQPFAEAPPVNALPALRNGYVTFGSFNRLNKLSPGVIATWSRLLRALPDSRMLMGAIPQEGRDTLIGWFAREGIARERLDFHPRCGISAYLALYHQVDICLDTFPYNGATTSVHALWMGVPTLTMSGKTPAGRAGAAIMGHAGLQEFVAHDVQDFVGKGLGWARDIGALAQLRASLRERCENSAMCQPALVADALQRAFRLMWHRWCDGISPEILDVSGKQILPANIASSLKK